MRALATIGIWAAAVGCADLPEVFQVLDAGASAEGGWYDSGGRDLRQDGGGSDGARPDQDTEAGADGGCGPSTPMYGTPCGDCGQYVCDMSGALICYDPGYNACWVCGELDESEGKLGAPCGSCGVVDCTDDGTATVCLGEHSPNVCGGCETILPAGGVEKGPPGEVCSSCETGRWRCAADRNDLVCHRGRGVTSCGGCERCVLYHAVMQPQLSDQLVGGGTVALIEDTGTDTDVGSSSALGTHRSLVFDPLVAGPGASALAMAYVLLSPTEDPNDYMAAWLFPEFAASAGGTLSDPVRRYPIASYTFLESYQYVLIYDLFFEQVVAVGRLVQGPPARVPGYDAGSPDSGDSDVGVADAGSEDA